MINSDAEALFHKLDSHPKYRKADYDPSQIVQIAGQAVHAVTNHHIPLRTCFSIASSAGL
jgi:hypothetical protein